MEKKPAKSKTQKVIQAPLTASELKRFFDQMPQHHRSLGAWGRQLILERLEQLEQAKNGKGR